MAYLTDISQFTPTKDYLICVDSDGCAMDTMDIKHFRCFGPCMVEEWGLDKWRQPILDMWNEINLYTVTRGINRFKGLVDSLQVLAANSVVLNAQFLTFIPVIAIINSILVLFLSAVSFAFPMFKIYKINPVQIIKTREE